MINLQSSYIFLLNPCKKKKQEAHQENVISIHIPQKVSSYITRSFSVAEIVDARSLFKIEYSITDSDMLNRCQGTFIVNNVADNTYLDIAVSGDNYATAITCLEAIQDRLQNSGVQEEYTMIISYDAISEYYCNQIYPMLNQLERNLRKLLFNTYVVNFGRNYYQATTEQELQNKIKGVIRAKGSAEEKEIAQLQNFFYSFEFSDIQSFLFKPKWTETDNKRKETFLSQNEDLSKLSDEELRAAFSKLVPQSDWERFFITKIDNFNVQEAIEYIRKQRNQIAHCKFFSKEDFDDCCRMISGLDNEIISAIRITEEKDFWEKNWKTLSESLAFARQRFNELQAKFSEYVIPAVQQISTVLEPFHNFAQKLYEVWGQYDFSTLAQALQDMTTFNTDDFNDNSASDDIEDTEKDEI